MQAGFSIKLDTGRNGVAEKLKDFRSGPELNGKDGNVIPADQTQIEDVKTFINARLAMLPEKFDGVLIIADGNQDLENGRSIVTIQTYGKLGHI